MAEKIRLGIIFGGVSSEHEVSLASAINVLEAIDRNKYEVTEVGITKDGRWIVGQGALVYLMCLCNPALLPVGASNLLQISASSRKLLVSEETNAKSPEQLQQLLKVSLAKELSISAQRLPEPEQGKSPGKGSSQKITDLDVAFPVLHGNYGEDGTIQGLLKIAGVAIVGSGVLGSAVAMDKIVTNQLLAAVGIPKAKFIGLSKAECSGGAADIASRVEKDLGGYPVFVKPANAGSSVGITKVHDFSELQPALDLAAEHDRRVLIEESISGRELEIGVLGDSSELIVSPEVSEIIPSREFYDYEAKYLEDSTKIELPARVSKSVIARMQECAALAFKTLDLAGMARVDFFYDEARDKLFLNEVNTIPGFTKISQYPALMKTAGFSYPDLIEKLIQIALKNSPRRSG